MRLRTILTGLCMVSALLTTALPAAATTIDECKALIDVVWSTLDGVEIGGGNPDRTRASLESKLAGAKTKLDQGKFADARRKLGDFQSSVESLRDAAKPKISAEDAQALLEAVGDAIACVECLMDPACP